MNPNSLQTISQIFIAIGIALTALGGFGSYYYGKLKETIKEKQAQEEIDNATNERKEIYKLLEPFTEIASQKYPNETDSSALTKLASELSDLEKKTKEIERKITPPSLNEAQKKELINKLVNYSGIQVILKRENNPILMPFINDLVEIFEKSRQTIIKNEVAIVDPFDGVTIFGKGEKGKSLSLFINDFYQGLKSSGIKVNNLNADQNLDQNTIGIMVGMYKN